MSSIVDAVQNGKAEKEIIIPPLRSDLRFTPAPDDDDGSPAWMVFDPLTSKFERVSWAHMEILKRLSREQSFDNLYDSLKLSSTIDFTRDDLIGFCKDIAAKNLTVSSLHKTVEHLHAEKKRTKVNVLTWLFHHYLYFRIPLIHPDNFLNSTYKFARILASEFFILIYVVLAVIGGYFLATRFEEYLHTFPRFYDITGVLVYGLGISCIKVIHEFSHAYVAKSQDLRVPTMGIAVIFLLPVPFCDTTDGWKLNDRKKRLLISVAGVVAELTIAGLSLFAWGISESGVWQSLFFILSSVSIVGTLFINLNPCMRYDGYFILSDVMQIDNLQMRATSTTKWFYRRKLFGLKYACPEQRLTYRRLFLMFIYSISAWIYRLFLYTSIALMVYYAFDFKLLGVILFVLEIVYFLILPVIKEVWIVLKNIIVCVKSPRFLSLIGLLAIVGWWLSVPLPHTEKIPSIIIPETSQTIYVSQPGVITDIHISKGDTVIEGTVLVETNFDDLDSSINLSKLDMSKTNEEIELISDDEYGKGLLPQKYQALYQQMAGYKKLYSLKQQMNIISPIDGVVYSFDDSLRSGVYVYPQQEIARIADTTKVIIIGYLPEYKLNSIANNQNAIFVFDGNNEQIDIEIVKINKVKSEYLKYPSLSSLFGGEIAVVNDNSGSLKMVDTYYEIEAVISSEMYEKKNYCFDQTGYIWVDAKSFSLIEYGYKKVRAVINKELNL